MVKKVRILLFIVLSYLLAIPIANSQCTNFNTQWPAGTQSTTSATFVDISSCMFGGDYAVCNVTLGETYVWTTCGDTNFDTQLTLTDATQTVNYAFNDDDCGTQSTITWTATFTGTVHLLVSQFNCVNNTNCMTLQWQMSSGSGPMPIAITGCAGTFTDLGGPTGNYADDATETWVICPDVPGDAINLTFTEFEVESSGTGCYDYMEVYQGNSIAGTYVGLYCGSGILDAPGGGSISSTATDGCLTIVFNSDFTVTDLGWIANISCFTPSPAINLTGCTGTFQDDGGAGNYSNSQLQTYVVCPDVAGSVVQLSFSEFDIEDDASGACFDYLEAYDGSSIAAPYLGLYCGNGTINAPGSGLITSSSVDGCLTFVFTANSTVTDGGWTASINCITAGACTGVYPSCTTDPPSLCTDACDLGMLFTPIACPNNAAVVNQICGSNIGATASMPYSYLTACQPNGLNMASPAADVWYSFVASTNNVAIEINGLNTPNIGFYEGTNCSNLIGRGCAVANPGDGTLYSEFTPVTIGNTYYVQISGEDVNDVGDFELNLYSFNVCDPCLITSDLTATPNPISGAYLPGEVIEFCYTISDWNSTSVNWLHGVELTFGIGWDNTTFTPTVIAAECSPGNSGGNWAYYNSVVPCYTPGMPLGQGFYFDTPGGDFGCSPVAGDGNPGNNYGDQCDAGGPWEFCWTIAVDSNITGGESLNIAIDTYGDSESGGWGVAGCGSDAIFEFFGLAARCGPPQFTFENIVSCPGFCDGSIIVEGIGNEPFLYEWYDSTGTLIQTTASALGNDTASGLCAGWYYVEVYDVDSCFGSDTVVLNEGSIAPLFDCPSDVNITTCTDTFFFDSPIATEPCLTGPCVQQPLSTVLANFNTNGPAITAAIPSGFNFVGGNTGNFISGSPSGMYDAGNIMNTSAGSFLPYTNGAVTPNTGFGAGGSYFTQKLNNMFVLGADLDGISSFQIQGNLGADGLGSANGFNYSVTVGCETYDVFVKRVNGTAEPSVNHVFIIPQNAAVSNNFSTDTDMDLHNLVGLTATTRLYYLLFAGEMGYAYSDAQVQNLVQEFLVGVSATAPPPTVATTQIAGLPSGSVFPVGTNTVTFQAIGASGDTSFCSFNINVEQAAPPSIVCPNDTIVGVCDNPVFFATPDAIDSCSVDCNESPLSDILSNFNANAAAFTSSISNPFNFTDGVSGTFIPDGGMDMYDNGNFLNTNLGATIPYTSGAILSSTSFGTSGQYFTRKFNNVFLMAADLDGVGSFNTSGSNGANGMGNVDGFSYTVSHGCSSYDVFVKRINGTVNPSINHIYIVPSGNGASQSFPNDTDNDEHFINSLNTADRLYYLLLGGDAGYAYTDTEIQTIVTDFLVAVNSNFDVPTVATVTQIAGLPSGSVFPLGTNTITFEATSSASGETASCSFTITVLDTDTTMDVANTCLTTDSGTTITTLVDATTGCDSIHIVTRNFISSDSTFFTQNSCNPLDSGVIIQTLMNTAGCDSIHTITTNYTGSDTTFIDSTSCLSIIAVEVFDDMNMFGCDSVTVVNYTFVPPDNTAENFTTCDPDSAGVQVLNLLNEFGCDSTHTITTTLLASDSTYQALTSCVNAGIGIVVDTFMNQNMCDSLHAIETTFVPSDTTFEALSSCNPIDTGAVSNMFMNALGCDSLHIVTTSLLPSDSTFEIASSCSPMDTGIVINMLTNNNGCVKNV